MLIDLLESSKAIGLCPMGIKLNCSCFQSESNGTDLGSR